MEIRAVSFDLGHTLAFPRYSWSQNILADVGIDVSRGDLEETESKLRPWFDDLVLAEGVSDELWQRYYIRFFAEMGAPAEAIDGLLRAVYHKHAEGVGLWTEPAPGAGEVLETLSGSDLQVVCVSNNDGRLPAMVEYLGWSDYFDLLVDSGAIGFSKPDPRIFLYALEQLGRKPAELIHVGDYYSVDVVGARRAGAVGVLYDPLGSYGSVDCTVIAELNEIFDLVNGNQ
jgi:putative hydrolase of the HAD superfamily